MTSASPANNGIMPTTRSVATIKPQSATGTGLAIVARIEVLTAATAPQSRSRSIGNVTTVVASTMTAKTKPMRLPQNIIDQPASVPRTSEKNVENEAGTVSPKCLTYMN
ncbi:hypothetical protein D9M69_707520 [compost metagenome]